MKRKHREGRIKVFSTRNVVIMGIILSIILTVTLTLIFEERRDNRTMINFRGEDNYPPHVVEDMVEDMLKSTNPYLDFEVDIHIKKAKEDKKKK